MIHQLSDQLKEYADTLFNDSKGEIENAVLDIANRVYLLEEEVNQGFQAGMEFAIQEFIAYAPDGSDLVTEIAEKVNAIKEKIVVETRTHHPQRPAKRVPLTRRSK
jgi:hypothetical protein